MADRSWSRGKGLVNGALAIGWGLFLLFMVVSTALDSGKGPWASLLIVVMGIICFVPMLFAANTAPQNPRHWTAWLQRGPISALYLAIYGSFGAMTAALALIEPRPATVADLEDAVREIRTGVGEDQAKARRVKAPEARVERAIRKVWGMDECASTYDFEIRGRALIITALRRPPGTRPFRLTAEITAAMGDEMRVTGTEPRAARGMDAVFTYTTTGATEELVWNDKAHDDIKKLQPCKR